MYHESIDKSVVEIEGFHFSMGISSRKWRYSSIDVVQCTIHEWQIHQSVASKLQYITYLASPSAILQGPRNSVEIHVITKEIITFYGGRMYVGTKKMHEFSSYPLQCRVLYHIFFTI